MSRSSQPKYHSVNAPLPRPKCRSLTLQTLSQPLNELLKNPQFAIARPMTAVSRIEPSSFLISSVLPFCAHYEEGSEGKCHWRFAAWRTLADASCGDWDANFSRNSFVHR